MSELLSNLYIIRI